MRILRVSATGFGALAGEVRLEAARLNVVVGDNEAGKTTLAAAVAAALYGLDSDARRYRGRLTPLQQFEPWNGAAYALEVVLETGGKRFTITRHFGRDSVTVFEEGRGNVTEDFRVGAGEYPIGEQLLGLSVDQFARSALWLQEGPGRLAGEGVRPDGSLSAMLERQASSVSGDASAQAALAVLDAAVRQYALGDTRIHVNSQVKRLEMQIEARGEELARHSERLDGAGVSLGELGRARDEERGLEAERRRAARHALAAGAAELGERLERDGEARAGLERRCAELAELRAVPPIPEGAADELRAAQAERQAAERTLAELAARRAETVDGPRREIAAGLAAADAFAWGAPVHLEEIAALERDFGRNAEAQRQARQRHAEVEADLRRAGVAVERLQDLRSRFATLAAADANLLAGAPASLQASVTETEKAERAADETAGRLAIIAGERRGKRAAGLALVALGVAAGAAAVWLSLRAQTGLSVAALAATLAALAAGIFLVVRAAAHRAAEHDTVLRALGDARRRLQQIKEQAAERTLALADLARRAGAATTTVLLEEHAEYLRVVREGDRLAWVGQDLERLAGEAEALRGRAAEWAGRVGLAAPVAEPEARAALAALREGVQAVIAWRSRGERLEAAARDLAEQEDGARQRQERAVEVAQRLVRALGTPEDDWERALAELEQRRQAMERLRMLEKTVADLERQVLPAAERAARMAEREGLLAEQARLDREHPEWAVETPSPSVTRAEIEARGRELDGALEKVRARRLQLERDVGWLDDPGRGDLTGRASELRLEIAELEREARRAQRFHQAVRVAQERLQSVARETNARWSEFLSRRVGELLPALGPDYRGFAVSDDLDYSLLVEGQRLEREKLDQVLSAGARDQLALALRLAVCEFLSRGAQPLPLVLDDPFATSDDARAEAGLRFLAETVAPERQVVLLTCHRARLTALRERDPEWFDAHVNRVELEAGERAGGAPGAGAGAPPGTADPAAPGGA